MNLNHLYSFDSGVELRIRNCNLQISRNRTNGGEIGDYVLKIQSVIMVIVIDCEVTRLDISRKGQKNAKQNMRDVTKINDFKYAARF